MYARKCVCVCICSIKSKGNFTDLFKQSKILPNCKHERKANILSQLNFSTQILAFTLSKDPEEMKIIKVLRNKNQPKTETWEEKQNKKIQLP